MAHKFVSKAEAQLKGLPRYFTGKPCPKGHIAERYTNSGKCIECHAERNKQRKRDKTDDTKMVVSVLLEPPETGSRTIRVPFYDEPDNGSHTPDWRYYAERIATAWQKTTESILEVGAWLIEAKNKLVQGEFGMMLMKLPFGERTAQRLMEIARNPVLSDPTHGSVLPPSWRTLYELSRIDDNQVLLARIEDGTINPGMERKDVAALTARHPQTKLRRRSKADDRIIAQAEEINNLKEQVSELEAARDVQATDLLLETDDAPTVAEKLFMLYGKDRAALIVMELEKLLGVTSPLPEYSGGGGILN